MKRAATLVLALLLSACSQRVISADEVAARRSACLTNGGTFRKHFNDDGTVYSTRCTSQEVPQ